MTEVYEKPDVHEDHVEDVKILLLGIFCVIILPLTFILFAIMVDKIGNYMNDDLRIYPFCITAIFIIIFGSYLKKKFTNNN